MYLSLNIGTSDIFTIRGIRKYFRGLISNLGRSICSIIFLVVLELIDRF